MSKHMKKLKLALRILDIHLQFIHDPRVLEFITKGHTPAIKYKDEYWYFRGGY